MRQKIYVIMRGNILVSAYQFKWQAMNDVELLEKEIGKDIYKIHEIWMYH